MAFLPLRDVPPGSDSISRTVNSVKPAFRRRHAAESPAMPPPITTIRLRSMCVGVANRS